MAPADVLPVCEVSYLRKADELLNSPLSYFLDEPGQGSTSQIGDFNQFGSGNTQKDKVSKAPAHELASELAACQRELEVTRALIAAKDETISLLRANYTRPN